MTSASPEQRLILLFGQPDQGKSTSARQLKDQYGYFLVSVDAEYVCFIRTQLPKYDRADLWHIIQTHYDQLVKDEPGILQQWQDYLAERIRNAFRGSKRVVVEGYALKDILGNLETRFGTTVVLQIVEAKERKYFCDGQEVTLDAIALD